MLHLGSLLLPFVPALLAAPTGDWTNLGGNAARNGQSDVTGPAAADVLWDNTDDFSIIAWHPFVEDGRVFTIRESGFPQQGGAANDALVAYDLDTGAELWRITLPYAGDPDEEWIAWIGGVRDGRVYASRSSNLQPQPMRAYDAATGGLLWTSTVVTEAFAYDGVVFAPNGDPIVGDRNSVHRLDAVDGSMVWSMSRSCPVSGNCGAAATDTALFIDEPVAGGNRLTKLDIATGAVLYSGPTMPGFTDQNTPVLAPSGDVVYFSRTQNNGAVDFLYAFADDGNQLTELWNRPVRWTTSHEHGIGQDGSIYTFTPADEFVRLDPATGDILDNAGVLSPLGSPNLSPKTAVDGKGNVYVSNGWANNPPTDGRLWAFTADLSHELFTLTLNRQNAGGPALARDGTLVVCDRSGVYAYRESEPPIPYCTAKINSCGGTPAICWSGVARASETSGFHVFASGARSLRSGLVIYSDAGPAATPFQGGFLCVQPSPLRRGTPVVSSDAGAGCEAIFDIDWNAFASGNLGGNPAAFLKLVGQQVNVQWWGRDSVANGSFLSDGLEYRVRP